MDGATRRHPTRPMPNAKRRLARAMCALFLFSGLSACSANENELTLTSDTGAHHFQIEIADDDSERAKGLMYRTELGPDAGMLFDFYEERPVSFWMRNTLIPLDMIFVKANGRIVNIHVNAKPHDPTPIPSAAPVRFVFEIAGGRAAQIGLKAGDMMTHPRVTATP
jgi:uncharacterized membrane protein (UPF0127 family)